ncbi:hypothetical protein [Clostridioides difficile]|uniref:hypothetical protein n=1 Tax=Clostridioides difficile TaxID=1496 RepID=UPI001033F8CA|nr:hypothetical protein [Clostridioides difficile]
MLENTSLNIIENLNVKLQLTPYQINQLKKVLKYLHKDDILYPGALKAKLNLDIKIIYNMLEYMVKDNILERNYELYCSDCEKFKGKIVKSLNDIPEFYCDFCNEELNPLEDSIVIYRVIINE